MEPSAAQLAILNSLRAMQGLSNAVGNTEQVIAAATAAPAAAGGVPVPCPPGGRAPIVILKADLRDLSGGGNMEVFSSNKLTAMWLWKDDDTLVISDAPLVIMSKLVTIPESIKTVLVTNTRRTTIKEQLKEHFTQSLESIDILQKELPNIARGGGAFNTTVMTFINGVVKKLRNIDTLTKDLTATLNKYISTVGTSRATLDVQDRLMTYFAQDITNAAALENELTNDPIVAEQIERKLRAPGSNQSIPRVMTDVDPTKVGIELITPDSSGVSAVPSGAASAAPSRPPERAGSGGTPGAARAGGNARAPASLAAAAALPAVAGSGGAPTLPVAATALAAGRGGAAAADPADEQRITEIVTAIQNQKPGLIIGGDIEGLKTALRTRLNEPGVNKDAIKARILSKISATNRQETYQRLVGHLSLNMENLGGGARRRLATRRRRNPRRKTRRYQ